MSGSDAARRRSRPRHRRAHRQLLQPHARRWSTRFGDKRVTYAVFLRRPVISAPRLMLDWLDAVAAARGDRIRHRPDACRRASWVGAGEPIVYITGSLVASVRSGNDPAAEARPGLRRRAQRLPDVPGAAEGRLPGDGGAPLRRRRDAGHDGLCRPRRQRRGAARGREGLRRQRQRRHRALVRRAARPRHHAARADRLCRLHGARGRDVPRDLPRRADDRAGRLFRPRDHRRAGRLRAASPTSPRPGGCRSGSTRMAAASWRGSIRRRATRCWNATRPARSAAIAARRSCATWSAPASPPPPIWRMREALDEAGFTAVRIVASLRLRRREMPRDGRRAGADRRGRHRQLHPGSAGSETYATADIVDYDGVPMVKVGREFLLRRNGARRRGG